MFHVQKTLTSRRQDEAGAKPETPSLWQRLGLLVFLVAATAAIVNFLTLAPFAHIKEGNGDTSFLQSSNVYQSAANQLLAKSALNRNKITLNSGAISQSLLKQFPELASAQVSAPLFGHQPVVYLQPVRPALLLKAAGSTYIIDTSGKALAYTASKLDQGLPLLTDQSGLKIRLNKQVLPTEDVSFIRDVLTELNHGHYNVSGFSLPPASSEVDAHLTGQGYYIKFNLQNNDPREQVGTFLAAMNQLKKTNVTPSKYVDVRVDGRAYYQ